MATKVYNRRDDLLDRVVALDIGSGVEQLRKNNGWSGVQLVRRLVVSRTYPPEHWDDIGDCYTKY